MEMFGLTTTPLILFFILYGVPGVVPLIAVLYLLLCPGNAFAPDVTPPVRLRRWAASFFAIIALGHVWWMAFYINHGDHSSMDGYFHSATYWCLVVLDYVTLFTSIAGTLLAMLQDRRRPVWPVFAAVMPFVVMGGVLIVNPCMMLMQITFVYFLLLFALFTVYVMFAVKQYERWLNDNYADLENKKVWLTHVLLLVFMLMFILYAFVDVNSTVLIYLLHILELAIFGLLLWRVETLPRLSPLPLPVREGSEYSNDDIEQRVVVLDLEWIEQLLKEHCIATQLYLRNDLTLQQLAQAVGTNRFYLSQYFSRNGITYNTYINNLRINHFIDRYEKLIADGQSVVAQELAQESGFRSYRTFSRAFMQRMGQSVTTWTIKR